MVHLYNIPKPDDTKVVSLVVVLRRVIKVVDVREHFENVQEFEFQDDMLQWIHLEATRLGFGIVMPGNLINYLIKLYKKLFIGISRSRELFELSKRRDWIIMLFGQLS